MPQEAASEYASSMWTGEGDFDFFPTNSAKSILLIIHLEDRPRKHDFFTVYRAGHELRKMQFCILFVD